MNLIVNKQTINNKFLDPISRLTNSCALTIADNNITTLTHNEESGDTIVLYGLLKIKTGLKQKESVKLNIPDVKRLSQMFNCVDGESITLKIDSNSINYASASVRFKYHLWEDGVMQSAILNADKINKLVFDCEFNIEMKKLNEILRASSVVPWPSDANKVYFFTKDKMMYAELTDKTNQNLDSITFAASESYTGNEIKNVIPISLEVFRMISGLKIDNICVKINTNLKILLFEIKEEDLVLKYLVSSLIK